MKQKTAVHLILLLIIPFVIVSFSPSSFASSEFDAYFKGEYFTWKEFIAGEEVVEETGPRIGIGGTGRWNVQSLVFTIKGEFMRGNIDYDGETTGSPPPIPVETVTDYFSLKVEGRIGWEFMLTEKSSLEPFLGPGFRYWIREINSTKEGNISIVGVEETWISVYAPLGLRGKHIFSDQLSAFAEGGVYFPLYNENEADLSKLYGFKVTVEPGKEISGFAEAGLKWERFIISVYYEGLRFSESDTVGPLGVFQPESEADIFGLNIGVAF